MKTTKNLLIALSAATLLSFAGSVQAGDGITASPKGRQFLNERGPGMVKGTPAADAVSISYRATGRDGITASPKLRQFIDESRGVESTGPTMDLAHAPRPTVSPKDPRYDALWRANAEREFQIAPVKLVK